MGVNMMKLPWLLLTLVAGGSCALALAIRHDVEEARYVELGEQFQAVAHVGGLGSGTLIAPDWVLTAAHVPEMIQRVLRDAPLRVEIAGESYEVARVVYPEGRGSEGNKHDIALLELGTAVPDDVEPIAIWDEEVEAGHEFVLAGWGVLAVGDEGLKMSREVMALPTRRLRAGWNRFDRVDAEAPLLQARFDSPAAEGETVDHDAHALEASPSVGDSGGPALIQVRESDDGPARWFVAGVTSAVDDADDDRILGEYGDTCEMTPVSAYAEWIRATLDGDDADGD